MVKDQETWNPNTAYCKICPSGVNEVETRDEDPLDSWFCPLLNGKICESCCKYDMGQPGWPRGERPDICKEEKCPHWNKDLNLEE